MQKKSNEQSPLPDLKSCPFCGAAPDVFFSRSRQVHSIACTSDDCSFLSVHTQDFSTFQEAALVWNTRHQPSIPEYLKSLPLALYLLGSVLFSIGFGLKEGIPYLFSSFGAALVLGSVLVASLQDESEQKDAQP